MKTQQTVFASAFALGFGLGAFVLVFTGCQSTPDAQVSGQQSPDQANAEPAHAEISGAQLWAQTCAHCHNSRSPASYNDAKWALTVNHMRQQAYLTGEESRKILEFLQASN